MKRKVLFITPSLWMGGTNAALSCICNSLSPDEFDIKVYVIQDDGDRDTCYNNLVIKRDSLLSAYYCGLNSKKNQALILMVKSLKRLSKVIHFDLEQVLLRRAANRLSCLGFDTVVGFMEGRANELASLVSCSNKVGWIQCNYNQYLPIGKDEQFIYQRFDTIVNVSHYTNSVFEERYPRLKGKTKALYHIFDVDNVVSSSKKPIENPNFDFSGFTIVSIGRVSKVKRFPEIPNIARGLKEKGCKFKWYIIGMPSEISEVNLLRKGIEANSVEDCVSYLGSVYTTYNYLSKADLLVSVSSSEACPMIFNEAKILGVPIVSTNFPSAYEFIDEGKDGFISDISQIANPISCLITDVDLYKTIKQQVKYDEEENQEIIRRIKEIL